MPTVTHTCPDTGKKKTKVFPYNAVGKAHAKLMDGAIKYNPGMGMEKKMRSSGY